MSKNCNLENKMTKDLRRIILKLKRGLIIRMKLVYGYKIQKSKKIRNYTSILRDLIKLKTSNHPQR